MVRIYFPLFSEDKTGIVLNYKIKMFGSLAKLCGTNLYFMTYQHSINIKHGSLRKVVTQNPI